MMHLALLCAALPAVVSPAAALTLKNLDPEDRKVLISENDKKTEKILKPAEVVEGVCAAACEIEAADGYVYEFDGNEFVVIEEGLLFIGEPDAAKP
ncbi:MAG: hypothetical protein NW215_09260 [Hyphomicrobiales bacterium]|nr:hypothetical protein [Hyphomicrobiales bacterium]